MGGGCVLTGSEHGPCYMQFNYAQKSLFIVKNAGFIFHIFCTLILIITLLDTNVEHSLKSFFCFFPPCGSKHINELFVFGDRGIEFAVSCLGVGMISMGPLSTGWRRGSASGHMILVYAQTPPRYSPPEKTFFNTSIGHYFSVEVSAKIESVLQKISTT